MAQGTLHDAIQLLKSGKVDEGVLLLRQTASQGDPEALFLLADMTWSGTKVPQDPARGRLLFEYAAALGHPRANLVATNLMASGIAGKRNWPAALERLAAEARQLPERRSALELLEAMDLDDNGDPRSSVGPRMLSERPSASLFERLMTSAECAYLINAAEDLFRPSMVYDREGREIPDAIRTSDGAGFNWLLEDPAIHALNRRIAKATGTTYHQGEPLQVLRYAPSQEYKPHFDYLEGVENPRPWTALIYLNEDYEGGETAFVDTDLQVRGRTGDVLLFRNEGAGGLKDPLARHAGMPVTSGKKYLATRWIRARRWTP
jgi:prolyl 4-hydroxylase